MESHNQIVRQEKSISMPQATLFNDMAIALFVLDVFWVIIGWPTTYPDESFAETYIAKP